MGLSVPAFGKVQYFANPIGDGEWQLSTSRLACRLSQEIPRHGVPKNKIRVSWHGVKNPVSDNETEEACSKNRRVVVKLMY